MNGMKFEIIVKDDEDFRKSLTSMVKNEIESLSTDDFITILSEALAKRMNHIANKSSNLNAMIGKYLDTTIKAEISQAITVKKSHVDKYITDAIQKKLDGLDIQKLIDNSAKKQIAKLLDK